MTSHPQYQNVSTPSQQKNLPTVPMSVYRELAGELQATKTQLDSLKQENQHLYQQNQSLRLEISKLSQSVERLESILSEEQQPSLSHFPTTDFYQSHASDLDREPTANYFPQSSQETLFTEQTDYYPREGEDNSKSQEVNGWLVMAVILMIIVTFSGIGYLVVQPLMNNNNEQ
ncbi:MAG: hypothetical protein ACLFQP_01185 [Halothece sp.]